MAEDIASLGMRVDSQGIAEGAAGLDKLATSAAHAETAAQGAEGAASALAETTRTGAAASAAAAAALEKEAAASTAAAVAQERQAQASRSSQSAQIAVLQAAGRYADQGNAGIAQQASQHAAQQAQDQASASLRQLYQLNKQFVPAQEKTNTAQAAGAISAKQYAAAMRLVPAQLTDIVTQLASGSPAYLIAIQQGGQLRDSFGSVGATFKALASLITPTTLLIGGAAAAAGALALAYHQGSAEGDAFRHAITLTGNAAGTTSQQLSDMAADSAKVAGTQHEAAGILAQLVSSGKVANDQLQGANETAIALSRNAGISADETVKAFVQLGTKPSDAIRALNSQYHFLTASTYDQIRALEDEGKQAEAAALAQTTFATALSSRAKEAGDNLGYVQRAARGVGDAAKFMWDGLLDVGREKSTEDKLKANLDAIERRLKGGTAGGFAVDGGGGLDLGPSDGETKILQAQKQQAEAALTFEQGRQARLASAAAHRADAAAAEEAAIKDSDVRRAAAEKGRQQAQQDADARAKAQLDSRVSGIDRALHAELDAYQHQGDLLDAQHSANLVSDADYYTAKRALIEGSTAAQVKALDDENRVLAQGTAAARAAAAAAKSAADGLFGKGSVDYANSLAEAQRKSTEAQQVQLHNDEQIKTNTAEKTKLLGEQSSQEAVLAVQENARGDALIRSYEQAKKAADDYLATLARQYALEEKDQFAGSKQRQIDSGRAGISDKYAKEQQQVEIDRSNNPTVDPKVYDQRLALIKDNLAKELALYDDHWAKITAAQSDWVNGAHEALRNYADDASNTAKQTETVFTDAFSGLEDVLSDGLSGSGFKFSKFIDNVEADITRLLVVKPLLAEFSQLLDNIGNGDSSGTGNWIGKGISYAGSLFGGGKASGGGVDAGHLYRVNENGVEALRIPGQADYLMTGKSGGQVIPNSKLGGAGGVTVNQQNIYNGPPPDRRTQSQRDNDSARRLRIATARFG